MVMKSVVSKPKESPARVVPAGEFKAKCLQIMDEVMATGVPVVVTKRGKEVGRFVAPAQEGTVFRPLWGRTPVVANVAAFPEADLEWEDPGEQWAREGWLPKKRKSK